MDGWMDGRDGIKGWHSDGFRVAVVGSGSHEWQADRADWVGATSHPDLGWKVWTFSSLFLQTSSGPRQNGKEGGRKVEWHGRVSVTSEPPAGPSDGERASDCPSPFSFNFLGKGCYRLAELLSKQAATEKGKERTDVVAAPPVSPSCPLLVDTVRGLCSGDSFIVLPDLALLF